ncbi:MAG: TonB-dependent receptor [Labilithrix sp.]|nr:TonB-dependent receptor [Labilithrix sp.]MCW5815331.1 TonB-dependent receptor [Labilithrix sp.]
MRRRSATLAVALALLAPATASAQKLTKPPRLVQLAEAANPEKRAAEVVLRITIGATGRVEAAEVVESAGPVLDAAALAAIRDSVFEPAEIDGKPSPIKLLFRYAFTIAEEAPTTATFEGIVRDRATRKPIGGVEIEVGGLSASTDDSGHFSLTGVAPGKQAITLSGAGLTALRTEETFEAGKKLEAVYDVAAPAAAGDAAGDGDDLEIVVTAPALEKHVVATEVTAEEGRRLPGTQGDVLKVIESMPGVARAQVGSGALVVWGAAPEDTRVYVDGVRVPRLYHGGGLRSVVATDLVESVELAPGGYGAAFGRGLGGLVTVRTRRLTEPRLHASAGVDLLDASAALRAPIGERLHVAIAARRSHLDAVLNPITGGDAKDFFPIPRYEDAQARVAYEVAKDERVEVTWLHSSDDVERVATSTDPLLRKLDRRVLAFERVYARWERGGASVVPWFGLDRARREDRFGEVPAFSRQDTTLYGLRASYRGSIAKDVSVAVGLDAEVDDARLTRSGSITTPPREGDLRVFGQAPADRVNADRWKVVTAGIAPYSEFDIGLFGGRVHVAPGLRFDPYFVSVSRKTPAVGDTPGLGAFRQGAALEPRLAVRWQAEPRLLLRAAYGRYHQLPAAEDLSSVFGNPALPAAGGDHFVLGGAFKVFPKTALETTSFLTLSSDLSMRNPAAAPLLAEALLPVGDGRAYGVQTLLRQELSRRVAGWVSYAVTRSERRDTPAGAWRPSDYDQTHVLSAVGRVELGKGWEVGARARWSSGFARTRVGAAIYDARRDVYAPLFDPKNRDRLPAFFQLDLRGSKRWTLGAAGALEAYLEVQNVTNRENPEEVVYSSSYRRRAYVTGLPLLPVAGLRWER